MSVLVDNTCINCLINRFTKIENEKIDDAEKTLYLKELLRVISDNATLTSAPEIIEKITVLHQKYGIRGFDFSDIKKNYNAFLLSIEDRAWNSINSSDDGLKKALAFAFVGNYIDFGALTDISEEKLLTLIDGCEEVNFSEKEYKNLKNELSHKSSLVYITDNCGEIVFDKLFIKYIKENYPKLKITVIVRGRNVLNDATEEDAKDVGLDKLVRVINNGTGIAGTALDKISKESLDEINGADIIISKGMGNYETLSGCKKNVYYVFMCKCVKFCKIFNAPKFSYILANEKRV